jgi:protein SCO1/2
MIRVDRTVALTGGIVLAAIVGGTAWLVWPHGDDAFASCRRSAVMGGPGLIGGPFTLTSEDGKTVTDKDVITEPSLVYFGYTFCPDVCPLDMQRNAETVDLLAERGIQVLPVFISVDPQRDTPDRLKEWTDYLHPRMLGLTGTPDQIREAAKEYRVFYQLPADTSKPDYAVGHTRQTYLMLPGYGFAEFYDGEVSPQKMADSVACFAGKV